MPVRKTYKSTLFVVIALICALPGYLFWAWYDDYEIREQKFTVQPGIGLRALARDLTQRGILREPYSFIALVYLHRKTRLLKAGEYGFTDRINQVELLDRIVRGKTVQYSFYFPEGWNFRQLLAALGEASAVKQTLAGLDDAQIMTRLGLTGVHPEGHFFPDTYYYAKNTPDTFLLQQAYQIMIRELHEAWENKVANLPLKSAYETLILASIVEKETGVAVERPLIAGVFINRLRQGMRLQTDPSVIYGLGNLFDGNLHKENLRFDTPYNTYMRKGLPPTPIAMPGRAALQAAARPGDTRALYFVAKGDGSHVFSETLEEHNKAVLKYQMRRNSNYVSTPPSPTPVDTDKK